MKAVPAFVERMIILFNNRRIFPGFGASMSLLALILSGRSFALCRKFSCFLGGMGRFVPGCAVWKELAVHSKTGSATAELIPMWMPLWTMAFTALGSALACDLVAAK